MNDDNDLDVVESFRALEERETISVQDLQTIYLGLGFQPTRFATLENLSRQAKVIIDDSTRQQLGYSSGMENDDGQATLRLTLQQTVQFLSKHQRSDRKATLQATFRQLDRGNKGYLDVQDVTNMAEQIQLQPTQGKAVDRLTEKQAQRLIHFSTMGEDRLDLEDFERIFTIHAPPEP